MSDINTLNHQIKTHNPSALQALQQLPNCALVDDRQQTPLNVAIAANNTAVVQYLSQRQECLNFAPAQAPDLKMAVKYSAEGMSLPIAQCEEKLLRNFGQRVSWQRTALLEACRHNRRDAISWLLEKGEKTTAKDVFGLGALEICFDCGGKDLVAFFIETCARFKKPYPVTGTFILRFLDELPFLEEILKNATLNIEAKRELFAFACATLNTQKVISFLQEGYNLNKMFGPYSNPLREVCCSPFIHGHKLAGYDDLIHCYDFMSGKPSHFKMPAEQLNKRLALLDIFSAYPLDPEIANKANYDLAVADFFRTGEIAIINKVVSMGIHLKVSPEEVHYLQEIANEKSEELADFVKHYYTEESSQPKASEWQLAGESGSVQKSVSPLNYS